MANINSNSYPNINNFTASGTGDFDTIPDFDGWHELEKTNPWETQPGSIQPRSTEQVNIEEIARLKRKNRNLEARLKEIENMPIFKTLKRLTKNNEEPKKEPS